MTVADITALGRRYCHMLPANYTLDEIALELGVSRQRAEQLTHIAMGKLVMGLTERLKGDIERDYLRAKTT